MARGWVSTWWWYHQWFVRRRLRHGNGRDSGGNDMVHLLDHGSIENIFSCFASRSNHRACITQGWSYRHEQSRWIHPHLSVRRSYRSSEDWNSQCSKCLSSTLNHRWSKFFRKSCALHCGSIGWHPNKHRYRTRAMLVKNCSTSLLDVVMESCVPFVVRKGNGFINGRHTHHQSQPFTCLRGVRSHQTPRFRNCWNSF